MYAGVFEVGTLNHPNLAPEVRHRIKSHYSALRVYSKKWSVKVARSDMVSAVAFSPDGEKVTYMFCFNDYKSATMGIVSAKSSAILQKRRTPESTGWLYPVLSPDGRQSAYVTKTNIQIHSLDNDIISLSIPDDESSYGYSLAFSPNGMLLAGVGRNFITLWSVTTGAVVGTIRTDSLTSQVYDTTVAFAPDGQRIAAIRHDGTVSVWSLRDYSRLAILEPSDPVIDYHSLVFSPDGLSILLSGGKHVWKWSLTSAELAVIATLDIDPWQLAISPDGLRIACTSNTALVLVSMPMADSAGGLVVPPVILYSDNFGSSGPISVAFSPDGHQICAGFWDGKTRLWAC